jgi:plasmid stabilization system protein ParE
MAGSVIWSIPALKELRSIRKYLTKHASPEAATRVTTGITDAVERLERFPDSGRPVPESKRTDLKELLVSSYRVIYRRSFEDTEVLRIVHTRRNLRGKRYRDLCT